eukprot:68470_1
MGYIHVVHKQQSNFGTFLDDENMKWIKNVCDKNDVKNIGNKFVMVAEAKSDEIKADVDDNEHHYAQLFDYWDRKSTQKIYVPEEYKTLKDEITNNKNDVYLNEEDWNEFMEKATHKYKS